jgi:type I restriction enzyme M protein
MRAIETANPDKLFGIFGDAQWTNKDRLSDAMLRDLIEHFSTLELTVANLPEDELGQGYEYLIKKFADDSGHTAAEFYTNRTVVHLMTEMLDVQPGESVYDPTCGSGGMLLSCIAHLRNQKKEWRNVKLYGQERNLMTSSIARMNCFLHGIEDFRIERGDTLAEPKLVEGDRLQRFDVVLANPPYSIKQWNREAFAADPWGRNVFGVPPQGRADYAFQQHILQSLKPKTGRCAVLWPHGVLFRQEEAEMRRRLIEADLIECVLGLGPNLFYNSTMEACVVVCRTQKPKARRGKILFINAVNEVTRERAQSFLSDENLERVVRAYQEFKDEPGFTRVVNADDIREKEWSLNISLFVVNGEHRRTGMRSSGGSLEEAFIPWLASAKTTRGSLATITGSAAADGLLGDAQNLKVQLPSWLDRSKWQRFPFGEIADCIREPGQPTPEDSATYIGLEHMDTGSLHVRRWGSEADLKGQKLKMRKGDILFAKRNAYLRRVAIAPHDGFFSAHGMILRARPDKVLPEFLPFLMMSDRFMNRAVEISVGSLSPTINWTTLKLETFDLPPLDQQRRIAEILWAVDEVQQAHELAAAAAVAGERAYFADCFGKLEKSNRTARLGEISDFITSGSRGWAEHYSDAGPLFLRSQNVRDQVLDFADLQRVQPPKGAEGERTRTKPCDIVITITGNSVGNVAFIPESLEEAYVSQHVGLVRLTQPECHRMISAFFGKSAPGNEQILKAQYGLKPGLNLTALRNFSVPFPDEVDFQRINERIAAFDNLRQSSQRHLNATATMNRELSNSFFISP